MYTKTTKKKGIATRLYSEIEKEARIRKATVLHADVSATALTFFEKRGFKTITQQTNRINDTEIVNFRMIKHL